MRKLLLVSILLSSVILPWRAASDPSPTRGFKRGLLWVIGFNIFYLLGLLYIAPRLS